MNSKVKTLMIVAMCGMLMGCAKSDYTTVSGSPYEALNGRTAKKVYNSLTATGIASLNYLKSSAAANATHFANFVDGLLTHNEFGVLELNLAESASHNDDYTEFSFKVRNDENICWVNYKGQPYTYVENGSKQKQFVKASDWLAGAKVVCDFSTGSDTYYLMTNFIKGALEYYLYTEVLYQQKQGLKEFTKLNTNAKIANWINKTMASDNPDVYENGDYESNPITADDIPNIANGSRLGVVVDDAKNTVTYKLISSAFYFPTLLTYSCYLPVNQHFYEEKGSSFGGSSNDSILYCGPYCLDTLNETNIIYKKNQTYAKREDLNEKGRGFLKANVDTVKYNIIKSDIDASYTRTQFEDGNIDGFSLSMSDTEGWEKYVTGEDDSGTLEDPYSGLVNARLLDTIGNMYGSNLVLNRTSNKGKQSYSSYSTNTSVANTARALSIQEVRQAIMSAFDYPTYYARHADGDSTSPYASQYLVHTYVPKNFVYDDNGNEYVDTYYAGALATKKGITLEQAQALVEPGQFTTRQETTEQVSAKVEIAKKAIELYNNTVAASDSEKITYPIYVEYYSMWDASVEDKTYDTKMINSMNKRLNGITDVASDYSNCSIFKVIPTDEVNSNNYNAVSGSSSGAACYDFSPVLWGWGADYGDPLTFLNTYTVGGDWKSIFPWVEDDTDNYTINAAGTGLDKGKVLEEYTALVKEASKETDNLTNRYSKFAEAEVLLVEELGFYKPQVNYGQGWALSISKAAGYEMPTANYGLSSDRLTGMWVLKEPLTRDERKAIRTEQEKNKEEYCSTHASYNIYGE